MGTPHNVYCTVYLVYLLAANIMESALIFILKVLWLKLEHNAVLIGIIWLEDRDESCFYALLLFAHIQLCLRELDKHNSASS